MPSYEEFEWKIESLCWSLNLVEKFMQLKYGIKKDVFVGKSLEIAIKNGSGGSLSFDFELKWFFSIHLKSFSYKIIFFFQ